MEHLTLQLLWATARLLVTRFKPYLPSGRVLLQGNQDVDSVQDIILLFYIWCESRELGGKGEFRIHLCNPSGGNIVFMPKIPVHDGNLSPSSYYG